MSSREEKHQNVGTSLTSSRVAHNKRLRRLQLVHVRQLRAMHRRGLGLRDDVQPVAPVLVPRPRTRHKTRWMDGDERSAKHRSGYFSRQGSFSP